MSIEKTATPKIRKTISQAEWETIATGRVIPRIAPLAIRESRSSDLDQVLVRDRRPLRNMLRRKLV